MQARFLRPATFASMVTNVLDPRAKEFYCHTLSVFAEAKLPVLIGGAYAFGRYTGIERHTKDFDVFVREQHFDDMLAALKAAGYSTEATSRTGWARHSMASTSSTSSLVRATASPAWTTTGLSTARPI